MPRIATHRVEQDQAGRRLAGKHFLDKLGREWVSVSLIQSPRFAQACLDAWAARSRLDPLYPEAPRHLATVRGWRFAGANSITVPAEMLPEARKLLKPQDDDSGEGDA